MSTVVLRAGAPSSSDELRTVLDDAFNRVKTSIGDGADVVIVVSADDLLGHRSPIQAAYVGALVGITRAVAFEGAKPSWKINAVATPAGSDPAALSDDAAVAAVSTVGLTGQVVTLGTALVGKVLP